MESPYEWTEDAEYGLDAKWHSTVMQLGYTVVPNALIESYNLLHLKPSEFLLLVNLISYWWDADRLPYPSVETLAERTNMSRRSVTRILTSLHKRGFIKRIRRRQTSNAYSLEPLIEHLLGFAEVGIALSDKRRTKNRHF